MFTSIILAAGMGTRMKSQIPKVMHKVCGKPLCKWVIDASRDAGADRVVTVIGHGADTVRPAIENDSEIAVQAEQKGTGHAVMQAADFINGGYAVILNGDTPLIRPRTISAAVDYHRKSKNSATVITAVLDDASGYGRIVRNSEGDVMRIVEQKDASEAERLIKEVNSGMYVFDADALLYALGEIRPNNAQGEYYLTDTLEILLKTGKKIGAYAIEDNDEIRGINNRIQLSEAEEIMRGRINKHYMTEGVTMINPATVYIEAGAKIGADSVIGPDVMIRGNTVIGSGCEISMGSRIENSVIGDGVRVYSSVVLNSEIGEGSDVGPFAYVRPDCRVGRGVKVGDFVELKNSVVGDGTKISHLTYLGDSDIGKDVNFGCGTVTCNYDGKNKYRSKIGDHSFIGCNTNIVSPVEVGKRAYIAAGSTITEDIPEGSLSIARNRQVNKPGWADKNNKY